MKRKYLNSYHSSSINWAAAFVLKLALTNLVFFDVSETGKDASTVATSLLAHDVRIGAMGPYRMRAVTHLDVNREQLSEAAEALRKVVT